MTFVAFNERPDSLYGWAAKPKDQLYPYYSCMTQQQAEEKARFLNSPRWKTLRSAGKLLAFTLVHGERILRDGWCRIASLWRLPEFKLRNFWSDHVSDEIRHLGEKYHLRR